MSWIHDFISGLAAQKTRQVLAWWQRSVTGTVLLVFCGISALGGLGFVAVGSYVSLCNQLEPWKAGLIVGVVIVLLALVGALIVWVVVLRKQHEQPAATQAPPEQVDIDTIAHLGETIGAAIFKNGVRTSDVVIAALVAGTVLGASPALRERLLRRKSHSADKSSRRS
jgi:hypothetical protein